ncbi:MAG: hybrid sensor histidine kinase/response regulator [Chloroflexota bacterium]
MTTILAIEDEVTILDNVVEILEIGEYEVYRAHDGREGIDRAYEVLPDLILCDINMPEVDGYTVLMELRSNPLTSEIPFIFLTAYIDRPYQRKGMNLGAADYLTKPFNAQDLLEAVDAQLKLHAERMEQQQEEIDRLRNSMILALPHELRTPLTGIITCTDMLLMDFDDGLTPDASRTEQLLRIMQKSGKRLQAMIENYLIYSQIELFEHDEERRQRLIEGEGLQAPTPVIQHAAHNVATETQRKDDLQVNASDEVPVRVNESNLSKITQEILDNAFKFSAAGSPVTVNTMTENGHFVLAIADKGQGMELHEVRRIGAFKQFGRERNEQQGSGLGLVIARRLAELHGGKLDIESEKDAGTTVTVRLPLMNGNQDVFAN